jgi:hypothetical protein
MGASDADPEPLLPLPAGFDTRFDAESLARQALPLIAIDAAGTMLWRNPAWRRFAEQNDGAQVLARHPLGSSYFAGIGGELRTFFEDTFAEARGSQNVFELEYECSSPEVLRLMRLRALPVGAHGLLLEHSRVLEMPMNRVEREAVESLYVTHQGVIVQCSNCRRVRRTDDGAWDWVASWVRSPHPGISHGLCDVCVGFYWGPRLPRTRRDPR